ncbi:MAG TPA: nitronate monooxygenase [Solirubrobacteraceae bacterium]
MLVDRLSVPIVLAPLAGGPSTPELTAAVSGAGGLGFLASGYLSPEQMRQSIERVRELTDAPFGVNVFVVAAAAAAAAPAAAGAYREYLERVSAWARRRGLQTGEPRFDDDGFEQKLELLCERPPAAVSFTFGCPPAATIDALKDAGAEVWVTVTTVSEAMQAVQAGAQTLVVQGAEAGGHRAAFDDADAEVVPVGLLALLALVRAQLDAPLVATGGIADAATVAAVLAAGARAAQVGTAFMLCPEAGTGEAQRRAMRWGRPTELTRAFTGKLARGIRNEFLIEHRGAPSAYPQIHHLTAPMRRQARERGDAEAINLWAGEAYALARELPAAELVAELAAGARSRSEAPLSNQ